MEWTAWQYRDVFDALYDGSTDDARLSIDVRLDQLLERGNECRRPITAPLGDGIHEFRAKDARVLFYFEPGRRIIFVVGIVKKQSAVPRSAIDEAKRIRKLISEGKELTHGLSSTN